MNIESKSALGGLIRTEGGLSGDLLKTNGSLGADDEIVAATVHLDHLNQSELENVLKTLKQFDSKVEVLTKKDLDAGADVGFGLGGAAKALGGDHSLGADLSGAASSPNFSLPGINGRLNTPTSDLGAQVNGPSLNADKNLNYHPPKFSMPNFNLPTDVSGDVDVPSVSGNVDAPSLSLPTPGVNLEGPDLNGPSVKLDAPTADINGGGKLKWYHKLIGLKAKGPEAGIDTPGVNIDGNVDVNSPKINLEGPEVKGTDMDLNLTAPKNHLKLKKPGLNLNSNAGLDVSQPKVNGEVDLPDVDLKADHHTPNLKIGTWKKPNFHLGRPKAKSLDTDISLSGPDASVKAPDFDVNVPKADLDVKSANLDIDSPKWWHKFRFPKAHAHGPKLKAAISEPDLNLAADATQVNIDAPDVEAPSGKSKWFKFHKPGTLKVPKANINAPNAEVHVPEVKVEAPDLNADVKVSDPNLNIGTQESKLHLHKIKLPKFGASAPRVKGPSVETDVKAPEVEIPSVGIDGNIDGPDVDMGAKKFKLPDFKFPKFSGHKVEGELPNLDLKSDLDGPDVKLPAGEVEMPGLTVEDPDVNVKKFKLPDFKLPKIGGSTPKVQADGPELNLPSGSLGGGLSGPKVEGELPNLNLKSDLDGPDIKLPSANFTGPKLDGNLPDPKVNTPDVNIDSPDVDLNTHKKFKFPKWGGSTPKIDGPSVELPAGEVEMPGLTVEDPDVNVKKFKMPEFKRPKFGKAQVKGPDVPDANLDLGLPSADASLPKADIKGPGLSSPNLNLGGLALNATSPDLSLNSPSVSAPRLDVNLPKADVSGPGVSGDVNLKASELKAGTDLSLPSSNVNVDLEKSSKSHIKFPKLSFHRNKGGVDVTTPDAEVKAGLDTPELSGDINAGVKSSPKSHIKWPFKWGGKSNSGTDEEEGGGDDDAGIDWSIPGVAIPQFKTHKLPRSSIDASAELEDGLRLNKANPEATDYVLSKGIRLPVVNTASKSSEKIDLMERLRLAKEKVSSHNSSPTEAKTDVGMSLAAASLNAGLSAEAEDSSLVRGGTFKVEKPGSILGLVDSDATTSSDKDKLSLGLDNMLGLFSKGSEDV